MAIIYLDSSTGLDADSGATWALAKAGIVAACSAAGVNGTIYVSQNHAETSGSNYNYNFGASGTQQIICGNDSAEPPTALATSATITATGAATHFFSGGAYIRGISFVAGNGASTSNISFNNADGTIEQFVICKFTLANTSSTSTISIAAVRPRSLVRWDNCDIKFGHVNHSFLITSGSFHWRGGAVIAGGSTPTRLFTYTAGTAASVLVENVDFSNWGTGFDLTGPPDRNQPVTFRNCKLPASWAGDVINSALQFVGSRVAVYNCDSGTTNYRVWIEDYIGVIRDETTLVRTGGASDGVTPIAWKVTGNANALFPNYVLRTDEIAVYNGTTGSAVTVTAHILRDNATALNDNQAWIEVVYPSSSTAPLGAFISDRTDDLVAAAAQASSSETWTTTGMANPNKQQLSVTFTPQAKGYFLCRVVLAANTTIYVCPKVAVA